MPKHASEARARQYYKASSFELFIILEALQLKSFCRLFAIVVTDILLRHSVVLFCWRFEYTFPSHSFLQAKLNSL
jgi:hypothetical protein